MAASALACGAFGRAADDPQTPDGGTSSGTTTSSSGGTDAAREEEGGGETIDGGDSGLGDCLDFRKGEDRGFALNGNNATAEADGLKIVVKADPDYNQAQKTFHSATAIKKTRIGVDMTISGTAPTGNQYLDTLALFYGLPADYQKTPQTAFEMVDKGGIDVDMWGAAASQPYSEHRIQAAELPNYGKTTDMLWIDTVWSVAGSHTIAIGSVTVQVPQAQLTDGPRNDFTIRFGGVKFNNAPEITLLIRRLCVVIE